MYWQDAAGDFAQSAFCSVAGDGIANFFGTGKPNPDLHTVIPFSTLKMDAGCRVPARA